MTMHDDPAAVAAKVAPPGRRDGPTAATPTYGQLLQLDELLTMQAQLCEVHDELFFIVAHQVYELWFKVILFELESARDRIFADDVPRALYSLRRVRALERVLVEQVDTLETISPGSFLALRTALSASSGFQSAQFREIEFLSGLKDRSYLDRADLLPVERARLERRLREPTLWDAFCALLRRRGEPDLLQLLRRDVSDSDVLVLAEALLDHDEGFGLWRSRHVHMVERMIGHKPGTGGSSGVSYLRSTLAKRFFPRLWELRSAL
jgi:tryptophan 2,3-dioxygenase